MKKLLSLYLLLSLVAQPLCGMQATPQSSSITGKTIAAAVGVTSLVAAVITYLLLAKSDKQVCDEFHAKVAAAVNSGDTTPIRYSKTTIRPLFSSEPKHGHRAASPTAAWNACVSNEWIKSQNGCYRALAYHDIFTLGPLRYHDLRSRPERNPHNPVWKKLEQSAGSLGRDYDHDSDRKQEPLEEKV